MYSQADKISLNTDKTMGKRVPFSVVNKRLAVSPCNVLKCKLTNREHFSVVQSAAPQPLRSWKNGRSCFGISNPLTRTKQQSTWISPDIPAPATGSGTPCHSLSKGIIRQADWESPEERIILLMKRGRNCRSHSSIHPQGKTDPTVLTTPDEISEMANSSHLETKNKLLKCHYIMKPRITMKARQTTETVCFVPAQTSRQILLRQNESGHGTRSTLTKGSDCKMKVPENTHCKTPDLLDSKNQDFGLQLSVQHVADGNTNNNDVSGSLLSERKHNKAFLNDKEMGPRVFLQVVKEDSIKVKTNNKIEIPDSITEERNSQDSLNQDQYQNKPQIKSSYVVLIKPVGENNIEGKLHKLDMETCGEIQSISTKSSSGQFPEFSTSHIHKRGPDFKLEHNPNIVIPGPSILERLRNFSLALKMSNNKRHTLRKTDAVLKASNDVLDAIGVISASSTGERYCVEEMSSAAVRQKIHSRTLTDHIIKARTSKKLHDKLFLLRHLLKMLKFNDGSDMMRKNSTDMEEFDGCTRHRKADGGRLSVASTDTTASLSRTVVNFKYSHAVAEALKVMYGFDLPDITKQFSKKKSRLFKAIPCKYAEVTNLTDIYTKLNVLSIHSPNRY